MHNVFLIGKGLEAFSETFESKGHKVKGFESFDHARDEISSATLILLDKGDKSFKAGIREVFSASKGIPKVLVSFENNSIDTGSIAKEPFTYSVKKPAARDLLSIVKRIDEERRASEENRRLKEEVQALDKEIKFFEDLSHAITGSSDTAGVLSMLIAKIREKTGAETCTIYLVDENSGDLVIEKSEGNTRPGGKAIPAIADNVVGWVAREGKPVLIKNVFKDPKIYQKLERSIRHKAKSVICVPIRSRGKTLGVLELINKTGHEEFSQRDFSSMLRLTDHVALVIERAILYEKMQELVITDDLTKLFNTRYMSRSIETEISRSNRYNTSVSLIFMDIDFFKDVNDRHGHLIGSKLLVEIGQLLLRHLRDVDIVARYGGDEFVIILPHTTSGKAVKIAERIRQTVEQHPFLKKDGYNLRLTASFGVAAYPENARGKEDLIRLADEAMYKVKHRTRNGVYAIIQDGSV